MLCVCVCGANHHKNRINQNRTTIVLGDLVNYKLEHIYLIRSEMKRVLEKMREYTNIHEKNRVIC